ncbi:hypothetical protein [Methylomonas sp. TEB]|uniref:hypothetical protein n=1 Tax=Methylomonas sp. TEB TaxID=3398229 RepID=UPI0039F56905
MRKYAIASSAIGVMQLIDAGILYSNNGVCEDISLVLSGIEFIWAITSLVVLVRVKHPPTRLLALAFFAYNAFGWLLSLFIISPAEPVVPIWFVLFGGVFGMTYAASALFVAKHP